MGCDNKDICRWEFMFNVKFKVLKGFFFCCFFIGIKVKMVVIRI